MPEPRATRERLTLPGNPCFGCGQENANGLRISVFKDAEFPDRLFGTLDPNPHLSGFPGIFHGGAIYTALDCMATWSGMILRGTKALWVLRSATMKYHRPALATSPLSLTTTIANDGGPWDAIDVRGEARDSDGNLLAEGSFKAIPVPPETFRERTGTKTFPPGWAEWLGEPGA